MPPLVDPCADTDAQDGPWATGTSTSRQTTTTSMRVARNELFRDHRSRERSRTPPARRGISPGTPATSSRRMTSSSCVPKSSTCTRSDSSQSRGRGTPLSAGVRHLAGPRRERVGVTLITPTQLADPACRHGVRISKETALDFPRLGSRGRDGGDRRTRGLTRRARVVFGPWIAVPVELDDDLHESGAAA